MKLDEIRDYLNSETRKDKTGGYLKPSVYQSILNKTNLWMFNTKMDSYEADQLNTDALRPFVVTIGDGDTNMIAKVDGYFPLPSDYRHLSSLRVVQASNVENGVCQGVVVEGRNIPVLNDDQFNVRRNSSMLKPTVRRPIGTIQNDKLKILPDNYTHLGLTYVRKPVQPFFDWTLPNLLEPYIEYLPPGSFHNGTVLPNGTPSRSVELEWPEQVHSEFAEQCLFYVMRSLNSQWTKSAKE